MTAPTKYHAAELAWAEAFGRASVVAQRIKAENDRAVKISEAWAALPNSPAPRAPRPKVVRLDAHIAQNRKDAQLAKRREDHA